MASGSDLYDLSSQGIRSGFEKTTQSFTIPSHSTIFKYNPHQMPPEDMVGTFVGREELLSQMVAHLRKQKGRTPSHIFLYGSRGMGKTTMLLALKYRLAQDSGLKKAFEIVQFSEEERRVANLPSFAVRVLELLSQQRPDYTEDLERSRSDPEKAIDILLEAGGRNPNRQVLLLLDNFDDLVLSVVSARSRRFDAKEIKPLDKMIELMSSPHFLLVATALQAPDKRKDFPPDLLERFELITRLDPIPDAMEFLRKRAERDRRKGFIERLPEMAARIEGLNRLAEGNPRLLVFLYECLGDRPLLDLVEIVQRTVDDLTPMYQDVINKLLNRGQAATLEMLAARGGVGRAKDIAELTFQSEQTVRTFLANLCDLGLVVRSGDFELRGRGTDEKTRDTIFRIHPPLFQIWYEMRHFQQAQSLFLVRFFSLLTEPEEASRVLSELQKPTTMPSRQDLIQIMENVSLILDPEWKKLETEMVDAILNRGGTLLDVLQNLDTALAEATNKQHQRKIALHVVRSAVKNQLGDFQDAEEDILAAERLVSETNDAETRAKVMIARSRLMAATDRYREASEAADSAMQVCNGLAVSCAPEIRACVILALADVKILLSDYAEAERLCKEAYDITKNHHFINAKILNNLGLIRCSLGDYKQAEEYHKKALAIKQAIGDRCGEASSLSNLGNIFQSLAHYEEAREYYQKALAIQQTIGDRLGEAKSHGNLGNVFQSLAHYEEAREYYQKALAIQQTIGDRCGEASSLNNLGNIFQSLAHYEEAREYYQKALAIQQTIGDRLGESSSLGNIGNVFQSTANYEQAREYYQKALAIQQTIGDRLGESSSLGNIGNVFQSTANYEQAREYYQKALSIQQTIGDRFGEAISLNNLGNVFQFLADYQQAREYYQKALTIQQTIGNRNGEATSLNNLGNVFRSLGDYEQAREYYQKALAIRQAIGDRNGEASSLNNLGSIFSSLADYEQAREYYQKALVIQQAIGDRNGEALSLNNLGSIFRSLADYEKAREYYQKALVIQQTIGDRNGEATSVGNIGNVYQVLAEHATAREFYQKALSIQRTIGDREGEAISLGNLGNIYLRLNDIENAFSQFSQAHEIFLSIGNQPFLRQSASHIAECWVRLAADRIIKGEFISATSVVDKVQKIITEMGSEQFLSIFASSLIVPVIQQSKNSASILLELTEEMQNYKVLKSHERLMEIFKVLLRYYAEGISPAEVNGIGPADLFMVRSLMDRIERPLHVQARELLSAGKTPDAKMVLQRILLQVPGDMEAAFNLASIFVSEGKLEEAEKYISDIRAKTTGFPHIHLLRAEIEQKRGRDDQAILILQNLLEQNPREENAFPPLAQLFRRRKQFDKLAETLVRWRSVVEDPEQKDRIDVWIPEAWMLAGKSEQSRAAMPSQEFYPQNTQNHLLLDLLRVFLSLLDKDADSARRYAGSALSFAADLPPGEVPDIFDSDFIACARKELNDHEFSFLFGLILAISQRMDAQTFADEFLSQEEIKALAVRIEEERQIAFDALKSGRLQGFRDLLSVTHRNVGPAAAISGLGEAFADFSEAQRAILLEIFTEAVRRGNPSEVSAALGAIGKSFPDLTSIRRAQCLTGMLDLICRTDAEKISREQAVKVLNILYPSLSEDERQSVRSELEKIREEMKIPALLELFNQTIPVMEQKREP